MTTSTRVPFRAQMRAAAAVLCNGYATSTGIKLQFHPVQPVSIFPPSAFVNRFRERFALGGPKTQARMPVMELIVIHAAEVKAEAVAQSDAFVDGFTSYVLDNYHAAGGGTLLEVSEVNDEPTFNLDWLPADRARKYHVISIALEGYVRN